MTGVQTCALPIFISVNDHYDSERDEGGLDIAFKNLVYDIYSRDLSKKVRQARVTLEPCVPR